MPPCLLATHQQVGHYGYYGKQILDIVAAINDGTLYVANDSNTTNTIVSGGGATPTSQPDVTARTSVTLL